MSFNAKDMTQGGQIASMRIRMFSQIANIIVYCLVILLGIIIALTLSIKLTWQTFVNGMVWYWCQTLAPMRDIFKSQPVYTIRYYGHELKYNAQQILQDKYIQWCADQVWTAFILAAIIAAVVCVITFFVALLNKSESADRMAPAGTTCYAIRTLSGIPSNVIRFSALTIAIASPTCAS